MADVVIVGGGITGCAAAWQLAQAGAKVTVLEAHRIAAMGSGWALGGVRQSGRHPAELPLARAAVDLWPTLDEMLGAPTEYRRHGNLRLARTPAEVEAMRALVDAQCALGLDLTFLPDTKAVRQIAPALSDHVLAASFCPTDGHANPGLATRAFAHAARREGADIREGVAVKRIVVAGGRVTGVETRDGPIGADVVVVAAGVLTPGLLTSLGLDLPLATTVVALLLTEPMPPLLDQVLGMANADCAGRQQVDGRLRVTTGIGRWAGDVASWATTDLTPTPETRAALLGRVGRVLPAVNGAKIVDGWNGLIDLTPDGLPVIDKPDGIGGLVVAAGFSGHGFCIGPITGEIIADLALGRRPRFDIQPFELARFQAAERGQVALTLHG